MKLSYVFDSRIVAARTGSLIHVVSLLSAFDKLGVDLSIFTSFEPRAWKLAELAAAVEDAAPSGARAAQGARSPRREKLDKTLYRLGGARRDRTQRAFFSDALAAQEPSALYQRHNVFTTSALRAARNLGVPRILEVNVPIFFEEDLHLRRLFRRHEARTFQLADAVIVVSRALRELLIGLGVNGERLHVMPNAVDTVAFHPAIPVDPVRERFGLHDGLVVGFVGSFKPWHGVELLLGVADALKERVPNVHLLLVGDAAPLAPARQRFLAARRGWITLTGRVAHGDVPPLIAAMDVAVIPGATHYGSPMKTFEYMAMGRAISAPRVAPIEEAIVDGQSGVLAEPGDADDLLENLVRLCRNDGLRRDLGAQARSRACAHFTWERTARTVLEIAEALA